MPMPFSSVGSGNHDRSPAQKTDVSRQGTLRYGIFARGPIPDEIDEESEPEVLDNGLTSRFRRFIMSKRFEFVMGVVIVLNMLTLALDLQLEGEMRGQAIVQGEISGMHIEMTEKLTIFYKVFLVAYVMEFILRVWALKWDFFRSGTNLLDMGLVILSALEPLGSSSPFGSQMALARLVRVLRLLRVARLMKCIRVLLIFQDLYILLKTLSLSIYTLLWSMTLVGMCVFAASLVMCQLVSGFVEDESGDLSTRVWIFENFGTTASAALTMFECALTPKWNTFLRRFAEEVHYLYAVFWLVYVMGVNFAVLKVVTALFIKQALAVAKAEEDRMNAASEVEKERVASVLREIFRVGDTSGDGVISKSEFDVLIARDDVCELIQQLGLEIGEVHMLFNLLCEGDGEADYHEFLMGTLRMQGLARTVDTIQILHEQNHLKKYVEKAMTEVTRFCRIILDTDQQNASLQVPQQAFPLPSDEVLPAMLSSSATSVATPIPASSPPFEAPWAHIGRKLSDEAVFQDVVPMMHESEPAKDSQDAAQLASLDRHL